MAAVAGTIFFLSVLGFAGWTIVATLRPRLARIAFLLECGPVIGTELPPRPRVTVRRMPAPVTGAAPRLRLAA
jgi:hypothetical protein